jgi:RNA polymerase sigma-70 factor (ECF subfamily)
VTSHFEKRATLEVSEVNREPAMILRIDGALDAVYVLTIAGNAITAIRVVRNPDKLTYIGRQLSERIM